MIVYFEDGSINNKNMPVNLESDVCFLVDAGMGFSDCRRMLRNIDKNFSFDTKVYTNSLDAFSNTWCWDEEKKIPMIYVRNENDKWQLISELTEKELRRAHNLEKLYVGGMFRNVAT